MKLTASGDVHEEVKKQQSENLEDDEKEGILDFTPAEVDNITFVRAATYNSNYLMIGFLDGRCVIYDIRRNSKVFDKQCCEDETSSEI
jgi:hypothetical protein